MTLPVTYSAAEVARALGKSEAWVRREAKAGRIPHELIGQSRRFTERHVQEFLAGAERRPAAPVVHGLSPRSANRRRRTATSPGGRARPPTGAPAMPLPPREESPPPLTRQGAQNPHPQHPTKGDPPPMLDTATARRRVTPSAFLAYAGPQNTDAWLAARREGIGASDIPAIVELSDYDDANPRAVYHDKRGELPDRDAGEAAQWGHALEDAIAREWARREGLKVSKVGVIARVDRPHHRASLDRRVHGCKRGKCALEVKTRSAFKASSWRDDMPDDVLAQVQWQHHVSGYQHLHVACLLGGNQLKTYVSVPEPEVIDYLVGKAETFWQQVLDGVPPELDPSAALLSLLDKLHPNREGTLVVDDPEPVRQAWRNYDAAAQIRDRAEARMDAARARAALLLGEHDELALPGDPLASRAAERRPTPLVRWRLQNTARRVDFDRLKADWPDAYAAVVAQPQTRVLRFLKGAKS